MRRFMIHAKYWGSVAVCFGGLLAASIKILALLPTVAVWKMWLGLICLILLWLLLVYCFLQLWDAYRVSLTLYHFDDCKRKLHRSDR